MSTEHRLDGQDAFNGDASQPDVSASKGQAAARVTRPLPAVDGAAAAETVSPRVTQCEDDGGDTLTQRAVRPETTSRPRKSTLAMAITRPQANGAGSAQATPSQGVPRQASAVLRPNAAAAPPDEVADEADEWAAADQPTVYLAPRPARRSRPQFLEAGENQSWPRRPTPTPPASTPMRQAPPVPARPPAPSSMPRQSVQGGPGRPDRMDHPSVPDPAMSRQPRLASPTGRPMPSAPPPGISPAAIPNPRDLRFQELRRRRLNHAEGERDPKDAQPVGDIVRRWWNDLLPGLQGALHYQREARESGVYPIPAYEETPTGRARLGDAFGRFAASARELSGRAQEAAGPTLKRLHEQAEQATHAIVDRIESASDRQQEPLLGPGRVAIFFRQGVTIGQAQSLLSASGARPIRLIPRKHGFLSVVPPGSEAAISERLRVHPYVRDVAYVEYDEQGAVSESR